MPTKVENPRTKGAWWITAIEKSQKAKKKYGKSGRWEELEAYYAHEFDKSQPIFNLIYTQGRSLMPQLIFQDPHITVTPRRPEHNIQAWIMECVDNVLVQEMEFLAASKRAILLAYLFNAGPMQVGFDFDLKSDSIADRARRNNYPWLDVIDPRRFHIDPGCLDVRRARWFAKELTLPTRILESDKEINQKATAATHTANSKYASAAGLFDEVGDNLVEEYTKFYEIHDAETGCWFWLNTAGEFMLDPVEDPLQIDGLPLYFLAFNEHPKSIWGTPDSIYIEPQFLEGNDCRRAAMKQRRLASIKFLIDENMLPEEEAVKLLSEDCPAAIRIKAQTGRSISEAIAMLQPHVQQELNSVQRDILYDAQLIMGSGPNQMGTMSSGRHTKYEAQVVDERSMSRIGERRALVAEMASSTFRIVNQLVRKNWKVPRVERIVGADAMMYYVEVNPADIKDEMDVKVDVESMLPASNERSKAEMIQVLQMLTNIPNMNVMPLIQQILRKFPWAEVDKYLPQAVQPAAMPQQQFMQQQQQMQGDKALPQKAKGNMQMLQAMMGQGGK